jgi:hypothetical protein
VAFHHTVREGFVVAKPCLLEGSRHWADVAEGTVAAGGNNWVECGQMSRARWSCASGNSPAHDVGAVASGLCMGPGLPHVALV